jgi:plasmid stability protein
MDMNIRNFPVPLLRELKVLAASEGTSLRTQIIGLLEQVLMERYDTPTLAAYINEAYPDERTDLMASLRVSHAAILAGKPAPALPPLTPNQRQYLKQEEEELIYERDEYSQA